MEDLKYVIHNNYAKEDQNKNIIIVIGLDKFGCLKIKSIDIFAGGKEFIVYAEKIKNIINIYLRSIYQFDTEQGKKYDDFIRTIRLQYLIDMYLELLIEEKKEIKKKLIKLINEELN